MLTNASFRILRKFGFADYKRVDYMIKLTLNLTKIKANKKSAT